MGLRPAGCHLDWCDDVNVGRWTPLALGATGGSLHGIERVCLRPQQHVYLPLRLLNSRKGEELLQAPWGCSLKGRQASSSNFSLSTPPSCDLPNFLHLIVFLSPNSVATNYSFSFLLVLITFFFHILVDHRNHKDVRVENQRSNFLTDLLWCQWGNIDMQGDTVQRQSKGKHKHKVVNAIITTWWSSL